MGHWTRAAACMGVVGLGLSGCQEPNQTPAAKPDKVVQTPQQISSGRLVPDRTEHDYGVIAPNSIERCEFAFRNPSRTVLHIYKVEGCCGVVTRMAKKAYEPGEQGTLQVEYYARARPGYMKRQIYVHSSDPNDPKMRFTIEAVISAKVAFEPNEITLDPRTRTIPTVSLHSIDDKPFSVKRVVSTAKGIDLDAGARTPSTRHLLRPRITWDQLQEGLTGYLTVETTHPECTSLNIPFSVVTAYQASPAAISLFNVTPGKAIARNIWILNNYGEPFAIESVSSANGHILPNATTRIANGYQLAVKIVPPAPTTDQRSFDDLLTIRLQNGPTLTIECYGIYPAGQQP